MSYLLAVSLNQGKEISVMPLTLHSCLINPSLSSFCLPSLTSSQLRSIKVRKHQSRLLISVPLLKIRSYLPSTAHLLIFLQLRSTLPTAQVYFLSFPQPYTFLWSFSVPSLSVWRSFHICLPSSLLLSYCCLFYLAIYLWNEFPPSLHHPIISRTPSPPRNSVTPSSSPLS